MSDPGAGRTRIGALRRDALLLLTQQIRRGRLLVRRLERREGPDAERAYHRWRSYTERLARLLLRSEDRQEDVIPAHDRSTRGPEMLRAALLNDLKAQVLEFECLAREIYASRGREAPAEPVAEAAGRGARVLIVHGRNEAAREKVTRFVTSLGLEPVIVAEEPGRGRTLIEKLEAEASAAFAVVLLTGDDTGGLAMRPRRLRPRARQNVIFELGFAVGKFGRDRVCALYEPGVELPSDYRGVEYTSLDPSGTWRTKLAKELRVAGLPFDPLKAL